MAKKTWRPEGWQNPHTGFYPTSETFEEGADAMLEAIWREGICQQLQKGQIGAIDFGKLKTKMKPQDVRTLLGM